MLRVFLAGIMQGSHFGAVVHNQDYRARLRSAVERHLPGAAVYDPGADHPNSLEYDDGTGRVVFLHHNRLCGEVDLVVAFVPEASMGTAIEMWEAWRNGRMVISIGPLQHNWAVKFLSHARYASLEEFEQAAARGELARAVAAWRAAQPPEDEDAPG